MKKALIALIIATMTLALAGCSKNKKEEIVPEAPASSAEEEKNDENTPKEDIKTDTGKETAETAEPANDPQLAEALKDAEPLYGGVIRAMYQPDISKDGVSYVPSDRQFFWLCVYFTANQMADTPEGITYEEKTKTYRIPADLIQQYANGCFGEESSLPEIPQEVTFIKKDGSNYLVTASDTGDTSAHITKAYANSDGTCCAVVDFSTGEGTMGTYKITFRESSREGSMFRYQITNAMLVK